MKKLLTLLSCFAVLAACEYDDSELWEKVEDLDKRIEALESTVSAMNSNISNLKSGLEALQAGKVIMNVTKTDNGYDLKMSDGSTISLTNGDAGADAPVIGVKQDTDGNYYWTQTLNGETDWLTDDKGNKIPATAKDGAAGKTPVMGIDKDGFWTVDYGNGPQQITDSEGNPISAIGEKGEKGDSFFSDVVETETTVVVTLANGTVITLPKLTDAQIAFTDQNKLGVYYGYTKTIEITTEGIRSAMVTTPCGWTAAINLSTKKITVSAPWLSDDNAEFKGYIAVIAVTDSGIPVTITKEVEANYEVSNMAEANTIMDKVIIPHLSESEPIDIRFTVTEDITAYTGLKLPAELTAATAPTITIEATKGSSAGYLGAGAYNAAYDGELIVVIPEGQTAKVASLMIPKGSVTIKGGTIEDISTLDAGSLFHVCEGTTINEARVNSYMGGIVNEGTIETMNASNETFQMINYGTIGTLNASEGKVKTLTPRPRSNGSSKFISKVFEYCPAPGQYGMNRFAAQSNAATLVGHYGSITSLGMFGGYIMFQFDHSVINWNGADFVVRGNAFGTSNEPAAVMVSYDANGNGQPDDEWFELKGDMYDAESTIADYEITYTKPTEDDALIKWTDNQGGSGEIAKISSKWSSPDKDVLTFKGRKIHQPSMWDLTCGYGYADTYTDDYTKAINDDNDTKNTNKFDIDRADSPVKLLAIDFVKVYNPVFQIDEKYPSFGEISPEISGAASVSLAKTPITGSGVDGWNNGGNF